MTEAVVHGTAIALLRNGKHHAVLLRGASGAGKSDLALRLLGLGARLVADDQVALSLEDGIVFASAPPSIAGLIEARGIGLLKMSSDRAPLRAVIDLVKREEVERLPRPRTEEILGVALPLFALHAFDAAAPEKVSLALAVVLDPAMLYSSDHD